MPQPRRHSRPGWTRLWATWGSCGVPSHCRGFAPGGLKGPFRLYDAMICELSPITRPHTSMEVDYKLSHCPREAAQELFPDMNTEQSNISPLRNLNLGYAMWSASRIPLEHSSLGSPQESLTHGHRPRHGPWEAPEQVKLHTAMGIALI